MNPIKYGVIRVQEMEKMQNFYRGQRENGSKANDRSIEKYGRGRKKKGWWKCAYGGGVGWKIGKKKEA